mmetsp:Transcript_1948/g.3709  ORF Transcript_1948/g.3709 Transcript_1948/m.3709 type:complete len:375 (+) Transcript_1948:648-1772(+)
MKHVLDGIVHGDLLGEVVIVAYATYPTNAAVGIPLLHFPPLSLHHGFLIGQHGAFLTIGLDHLEHAIVTFLFELELDEVVGRGVARGLGSGIIGGVEVEGGIVVRSGLVLLLLLGLLLLLLDGLGQLHPRQQIPRRRPLRRSRHGIRILQPLHPAHTIATGRSLSSSGRLSHVAHGIPHVRAHVPHGIRTRTKRADQRRLHLRLLLRLLLGLERRDQLGDHVSLRGHTGGLLALGLRLRDGLALGLRSGGRGHGLAGRLTLRRGHVPELTELLCRGIVGRGGIEVHAPHLCGIVVALIGAWRLRHAEDGTGMLLCPGLLLCLRCHGLKKGLLEMVVVVIRGHGGGGVGGAVVVGVGAIVVGVVAVHVGGSPVER